MNKLQFVKCIGTLPDDIQNIILEYHTQTRNVYCDTMYRKILTRILLRQSLFFRKFSFH